MTVMRESTDAADEAIESLAKVTGFIGHAWTAHERQLLAEGFNSLLHGNCDSHVSFDTGLPSLKIIQGDHYDQHMDEDEDKPSWDDMLFDICYVPSYVWIA